MLFRVFKHSVMACVQLPLMPKPAALHTDTCTDLAALAGRTTKLARSLHSPGTCGSTHEACLVRIQHHMALVALCMACVALGMSARALDGLEGPELPSP